MSRYRVIAAKSAALLINKWKPLSEVSNQFADAVKAKTLDYDERRKQEKIREAAIQTSCVAVACFCTDSTVQVPQYDGKDASGAEFFFDGVRFEIGQARSKPGELRWIIEIQRPEQYHGLPTPYSVDKLWKDNTTSITVSGDKVPREVLLDVQRRLLDIGSMLYDETRKMMVKQAEELEARNAIIQRYRDADPQLDLNKEKEVLLDPFASVQLHWRMADGPCFGKLSSFYDDSVSLELNSVPHDVALKIVALLKEHREQAAMDAELATPAE